MYPYSVESHLNPTTAPLISKLTYGDGLITKFGVSNSLAQRGFNHEEYKPINVIESVSARKKYIEANLQTTINHVFEDSVVSFTNYYQMNKKGEVVSYPDGTVLNIDSDERGGCYKFGIESAIAGALANPDNVVLFYSPPGPVVFDDNPNNKFREVKPYPDGQLYMMYSDGEKVNNVATSISPEGESWISHIMSQEYKEASSKNSVIEKIKYFITYPLLTGKSIGDFLDDQNNLQDRIIFRNKDKVEFSLSQTLSLIHQSLAGQLPKSHIVDHVLQNVDMTNITAQDIEQIYGAIAQQYMIEKGLETLTLGGFCGGTQVKLDIFSNGLENLSTPMRMITQGENIFKVFKDYKDDPNLCRCGAAGGAHFHCPGVKKQTNEPCKHAIVVGEGVTRCPDCGTEKTC